MKKKKKSPSPKSEKLFITFILSLIYDANNILFCIVEKKKTKTFYAAKIEKASKNQRNPMLFWESKLIHKMRGKSKFSKMDRPAVFNANYSSFITLQF